MLITPETIRTLQRKLYRKAKQEPACRFHALYDKVYRADILIAEMRPHPGDQLSVAQFRVTAPLRLLNLLHPRRTISPFVVVDECELSELRYDLAFLCHLESELSKPILPRVADLEYLPTQYLCEFIKNCGYDGVVFKSSISNGANVALFDDSKVRAEILTQYEVTKLHYEQRQIP